MQRTLACVTGVFVNADQTARQLHTGMQTKACLAVYTEPNHVWDQAGYRSKQGIGASMVWETADTSTSSQPCHPLRTG